MYMNQGRPLTLNTNVRHKAETTKWERELVDATPDENPEAVCIEHLWSEYGTVKIWNIEFAESFELTYLSEPVSVALPWANDI